MCIQSQWLQATAPSLKCWLTESQHLVNRFAYWLTFRPNKHRTGHCWLIGLQVLPIQNAAASLVDVQAQEVLAAVMYLAFSHRNACHYGKFRKRGNNTPHNFPAGHLYSHPSKGICICSSGQQLESDSADRWPLLQSLLTRQKGRYSVGRGQQLTTLAINSMLLSTLTVLHTTLHPLQGPLPLHGLHYQWIGPINSITPLTVKCKERHKLNPLHSITVSSDSGRDTIHNSQGNRKNSEMGVCRTICPTRR